MHRLARHLFAAAAMLLGGPLWACTCGINPPLCATYFATPVLLHGIVLEKTLERPPPQTIERNGSTLQVTGMGVFKVRLALVEGFKGVEGRQEVTVYTNEQTSACGFPFQVGHHYLVASQGNAPSGKLFVSRCSQTRELRDGVDDSDLTWMRNLPRAPPGASIFGHVTLRRAGPMPGVKITITGASEAHLSTDQTGAYEVHAIAPGDYQVAASVPTGFSLPTPERSIRISDKGCAEVDWFVAYDAHVRGRVLDEDGKPLSRIVVQLGRRSAESRNGLVSDADVFTDENGRYDISGVSPGQYRVMANQFGSTPTMPYPTRFHPAAGTLDEAAPVTVNASASVDGIDVVMPRAWKKVVITAHVVDQDGSPVVGARLFGHETDNRTSGQPMTAMSADAGVVTIAAYEGRDYDLTALTSDGPRQRCGGPLRFTAHEGLDVGTIRIEHPWGNCLAQSSPTFRPPAR